MAGHPLEVEGKENIEKENANDISIHGPHTVTLSTRLPWKEGGEAGVPWDSEQIVAWGAWPRTDGEEHLQMVHSYARRVGQQALGKISSVL